MTACPGDIDREAVRTGEFFRSEITGLLHRYYGVNFESQNAPTINISYRLSDGTPKVTEFQLDGYDADKCIGYQMVTESDKTQWEESREQGNELAPNLNDIALIQRRCIQYEFPVLFICSYPYQTETQKEKIMNNLNAFREELYSLLEDEEIADWARQGLYDGQWIKESIEENYGEASIFNICFSHDILPNVSIEYGQGKKAVFQLDGYDQIKKVGYKFVTEADENIWNEQHSGINNPDLNYYEEIRENALNYDYPVIFIYYPEYWKTTINIILNENSNDIMLRLKEWLKIS